MIDYISLPKKHFVLALKEWEFSLKHILSDYNTYLSPTAYKTLNTLVVELHKTRLELEKYV